MSGGVIFSDESGQDNSNRYAAICTVSGLRKNLLKVHNELKQVLDKHDKQEIKFKSIKGGAKLKLGKEFLEVGLNKIESKKLLFVFLKFSYALHKINLPIPYRLEKLIKNSF
jgi:hypothetical protein